ncbi:MULTISPECIES: SusC/RagA family TonB-linked outer membrane protein [unclassified Arenibacter]|uniref:SusC/RagA family TonB-linked outer membrane protein n=1 Tax=unclassified Arenibacter TaxID=2615047 RepID=UPI000E3428B6|nr:MULTISPECIES: SusC/RagA family TonB-linked outer membrane protein [unclassified Arenibacter]MCM4164549.1 SusC/RagA family TonB-linked outer membrane protein [Arenibacter sp. A80]RFT55633.1 SusC/RagA family TonB-linked outer membrane protein [Arenibacter sp. P308M17]
MIKKFHYYLMLSAFLCIQGLTAQNKTVSGTVSDNMGTPLPGVNVVEKGTTNGTSTDFDGNYSIEVSNNATLVFSSLGFTTKEMAVSGQSTINMSLEEDSEQLGEVVVTALGIKRETKAIGYAMTEVQGEELARINVVNPVQSLQGKSPGVSIGSSDGGLFGNSKIQIRGVSTLNSSNNQPIFVIDGVILENATSGASADWNASSNDYGNILKNLNPDDYKSVSILKGAAATALYGSRGINGVVLITTKDGSGTKGIGVSVRQSVGFDIVYRGPALQNEYGPGTLAGYVGYGNQDNEGNYYNWDTQQFYYNVDGVPTLRNHAGGGLSYGPKFDGRPIEDYDGTMTTYSPQKNNMLDAYSTGVNTNTSVALSGGNEKGNFYLSDSYNERTGTLPNNSFKRNSLMFRGSYNLAPWLRASASVSFTDSNSHNPRNDISQGFFDGTFERTYNTEKYMQNQYWQASHGGVPNANFGDDYTDVPNRGLWFAYENNNNYNKETVVRPIVTLAADVTDWLTITAEGNMNHYTTEYENKELGSGYANEGGYYELRHNKDVSKTGKLTFNFKKDLTQDLLGNLLLGGEIWNQKKSFTRGWTDGGLIVPGRFYLGNSLRTQRGEGGVSDTKQLNSLYFLANLSYKDQLFLDITGRNDWSSALVYTDGTGNNSYFYPSVSGSWVFSEATGTSNWFTFGKLRASWAQVGSDTSPYTINKGYGQGSIDNGGNFIYTNTVNTTLVDRAIKPERKDSYEIGADVRFFGNRLGIDVAYYDETISEQIGNVPLPAESGYNSLLTNIGTLTNSGLELTVTGTPIRSNGFSWNTTFNYWNNTTMIDEVHPDFGEYKNLGGDITYGNFRVGSVAFEGGEYGILYSDSAPKKFESSDPNHPNNGKNQLIWVDSRRGAYFQRSGEPEEIGKVQPDFEGSWNNDFNIGNFNLSILLDARFGGHMASYSSRYGTAYGYTESSLYGRDPEHGGVTWTSGYDDVQGTQFSDGVIPDGVFAEGQMVTAPNGTTVDVGGMTYQEAFDAGHVEPTHASYYNYRVNSWGEGVVNDDWFAEVKYIALRNISMGYNLPKMAASKMGARNVYLGINARNVAYLYNSLPNDINPESFRGTTSSDSFRERSFSPYMASYTFSIAIDF